MTQQAVRAWKKGVLAGAAALVVIIMMLNNGYSGRGHMRLLVIILLSCFCFQCMDAGRNTTGTQIQSEINNLEKSYGKSTRKEGDPYPGQSIPVYPGVADATYTFDSVANKKAVRYKITTRYPAAELIHYYDKELVAYGWTYIENHRIAEAKWFQYQDKSRMGSPYVHAFMKAWVSKDNKKEFLLVLNYLKKPSEDWSDVLSVYCQISPNLGDTRYLTFFDRMVKEGKWEKFEILINKYMKKDQTIDFERALRENPENKDLVEFYQIDKEMELKIKEAK